MKRLSLMAVASLLILTSFLIVSCEKDNDGTNKNKKNATVEIMLTDAPALYDAVNIEIIEVQLHTDSKGWINIPLTNPGIYNLLQFSNGFDTLLISSEIPEGKLTQVRLVLGYNNSIVVNSQTYPLTIPSGSTSGLKLNVNYELEGGNTYRFWLDFDAAHSVHMTGNGRYMLKPAIRMFAELASGAVEGYVYPAEALPVVKVYNATDTLMAIPDSTGYYKIRGIAAGTYSAEFSSGLLNTTFSSLTINDIQVVIGATNQLEPMTLTLP